MPPYDDWNKLDDEDEDEELQDNSVRAPAIGHMVTHNRSSAVLGEKTRCHSVCY